MKTQISTAVVSAGSTGTICERTGPYKCNSHSEIIIFFKRGDKFTACPVRGHSTTWSMVRG